MNKDTTKTSSSFAKAKEVCIENLWVLALLGPLFMMLVLGVNKLSTSAKAPSSSISSNARSLVSTATGIEVTSIEVTSIELASIVAKPIGKLLLMKVYFDSKPSARIAAYDVDSILNNEIASKVQTLQGESANTNESFLIGQFDNGNGAGRS